MLNLTNSDFSASESKVPRPDCLSERVAADTPWSCACVTIFDFAVVFV